MNITSNSVSTSVAKRSSFHSDSTVFDVEASPIKGSIAVLERCVAYVQDGQGVDMNRPT